MSVHHPARALIALAAGLAGCAARPTVAHPVPRAPVVHAPAPPPARAPACGGQPCDAATAISAGTYHACALRADHTVRCWGSNTFGQLGDGTRVTRPRAVAVRGLDDAVAIAAGGEFTCAVHATGKVSCWGRNWFGELGTAAPRVALAPQEVPLVDDAVAITAGHVHACVLRRGGKVTCWGSNTHGQVAEHLAAPRLGPVTVDGADGAIALAAGSEFTCARRSSGVSCWGAIAATPPLAAPVTDLAANGGTACARAGGKLACWQGGGGAQFWQATPQPGPGALLVFADGPYDQRVCAAGAHGVSCASEAREAAKPVPGVDAVRALDGGLGFACAIDGAGAVSCWGKNALNQLGDDTTADRDGAVRVEGLR